jgi:DnaJ-class molecular chaperone
MKKIIESRKLLGVAKEVELKELKSIYRNFMKDWHPDKIQDDPQAKLHAEEKSKAFIEAYHLLVSIAPETREQQLAQYTEVITNSKMMGAFQIVAIL